MAATTSFSTIATPPSSSSLTPYTSHFFTHSFSPKPTKPLFKTLFLKPHNFTLSPLHLCNCVSSSSASFAVEDVETEISHELGEIPDGVQAESEESELDETEVVEDGNDKNVAESSGDNDGRLYVGNLPFTATSSELSEVFSLAGQIKSVEIIYDKMTDRSRGFGFVTMETVDEAKEAIRMLEGSQIGGRSIRVNFPEVPKGGERRVMGTRVRISNQNFVDTPHKIYVGNLGWGVTTQGLRDAFADQPGFTSAKVVYERDSGRSRGFGFVSFASPEAAESALTNMNGMELEGRPLRLNVAADRSPRSPGSYGEQTTAQ